MRSLFVILILAVLAAIGAVHFGLISLTQTQPAALPNVEANGAGVTASGGQAPKFEVETGSVGIGSKAATVAVPTVSIQRKGEQVTVPAVEVRRAGEKPPAQPTTNQQ